MSSPNPYGASVPLGMNTPVGQSEWNEFLRRRAQLLDDGMRRLGLAGQLSQSTGTHPLAAFQATSLITSLEDEARQQAQQGPVTDHEYNRLLGAADFYGIDNAGTLDPNVLRQQITERREYLATRRVEDGQSVGGELYDTIATFLGSTGLNAVDAVVNASKRIPFLGDAVRKSEAVQNYQRGLAMLEEGFTGDMLDNERATYEKFARPLQHFLGYSAMVGTAAEAVGATGFAGGVANPLIRGSLRGGTTGWLLEGGGDAPISERAMTIALFAGIQGAAEWGLPKIAARLRRSFPRAADDAAGTELMPSNVVDAEWYIVDEAGNAVPQGMRPPIGPGPRQIEAGQYDMPPAPPRKIGPGSMQPGTFQMGPGFVSFPRGGPPPMTMEQAAADAIAATKQGTVLESPALPGFSKQPQIQDADVAIAAMASNPGQVSVIQGVGDTAGTIRRFLQEFLPNGVGPQDFRAITRRIPVTRFQQAGDYRVALHPGGAEVRAIQLADGRILTDAGMAKPGTHADLYREAGIRTDAEYRSLRPKNGILTPEGEFVPYDSLSPTSYWGPPQVEHLDRVDILVADGRTITNSMAKEYEAFGMFRGQTARVSGGQEVVIESLGPELSQVRTFGSNQTSVVATAELMPSRASWIADTAPQAYVEMKSYALSRMAQEATDSGLQPFDWFSDEMATQLPRYIDEFLDMRGIEGRGARGAYTSSFTEGRFGDFRTLAPEEFAQADALAEQVAAEYSTSLVQESRPISLQEVAESKGMGWSTATAPTRFSTAKGSIYEVRGSSTTRNKAARPEHPGDEGPQAASEVTFYVDPTALQQLGEFQAQGTAGKRIVVKEGYAAIEYTDGVDAGKVERRTIVRVSTDPAVGLHPVELWAGGKTVHFGNQITSLQPGSTTSGGVLRDLITGEEVAVESMEAGFQFLQNFNRTPPDYSPFTTVPVELAASSAGSANPGSSLGPRHYMTEVDMAETASRSLDRLEAAMGGGLVPPVEPPIPPGGGGGYGPPEPPMLPPADETLGAQFERLRTQAPRTYDEVMGRFDSLSLRAFEPMRNFSLAVEEALHNVGITKGTYWQHYSGIAQGRAVAHNEAVPWHREINEALSQIRRKFIRDGTVTLIGEMPELEARAAMVNAGYTEREVTGQMMLRDVLERLRVEYSEPGNEIRRVMDYMPHLRARAARGEDLGDLEQMFGGSGRFFANQVRQGGIDVREMNAGVLLHRWVRAATVNRYVAGPVDEMASAWVHDPRVPLELRQVTSDWLDLISMGHTPGQDVIVPGVRHALNAVGIPISNAEVGRGLNWIMTNMYRGALGGRPDVIVRDLIGPLFGGTRTGFAPTARAYTQFFKGGAGRQEMVDLALRGGWMERGMVPMGASEMFQNSNGMVPGVPNATEQSFGPVQTAVREGVARVGDFVRDALPVGMRNGIQGTRADPLYWYTKEGEFNRLISGHSGFLAMRDAIQAFDVARSASPTVDLRPLVGQLLRQSGAANYGGPIQRKIAQQVMAGQYEDAMFIFANEVANSQFRYGTAEQSLAVRSSGLVGRFGSTFGTFTQQYIAQMKEGLTAGLLPEFGGTAVDRARSAAAFLARHSAIASALGLATAYTGWNFGKWVWHGSLGWGGGPMMIALITKVQEMTGKFNQAQGEPVSPMQQWAVQQSQYDQRVSPFSNLNPYAATVRTVEGLGQTLSSANPAEGTLEFLMTGKRNSGDMMRQINDAPFQVNQPPAWAPPPPWAQGQQVPQETLWVGGGGATQ